MFLFRLFVLEGLRHWQVLGNISALWGQTQGEGKKKEKIVCPSSFSRRPGLVPPCTIRFVKQRDWKKTLGASVYVG